MSISVVNARIAVAVRAHQVAAAAAWAQPAFEVAYQRITARVVVVDNVLVASLVDPFDFADSLAIDHRSSTDDTFPFLDPGPVFSLFHGAELNGAEFNSVELNG